MKRFNDFYERLDMTAVRALCHRKGVARTYRKGEYFVKAGEVCNKLGLITEGYFKYSVACQDGKGEGISGFTFADEFVADFSHSIGELASPVSIVAGRNCEVLEVSINDFRELVNDGHPELELQIMHIIFRTIYVRLCKIYQLSPKERYQELLEAHPALLQDVPMKEVASYLLVSPVHLSRIRQELLRQTD